MINYGFTKEIDKSFDEAIDFVSDELQKEGFGILTKIDIKYTFKEKLDIDFKKYVMLSACNPPNTFKAIQATRAEENISLIRRTRSNTVSAVLIYSAIDDIS